MVFANINSSILDAPMRYSCLTSRSERQEEYSTFREVADANVKHELPTVVLVTHSVTQRDC